MSQLHKLYPWKQRNHPPQNLINEKVCYWIETEHQPPEKTVTSQYMKPYVRYVRPPEALKFEIKVDVVVFQNSSTLKPPMIPKY